MLIRLTKISESTNPEFRAGDPASFRPGQDNGAVSLPVDYVIEGLLAGIPLVGHSLRVFRTCRNGVKSLGNFSSSTVKSISPVSAGEYAVETNNSKYKLVILRL